MRSTAYGYVHQQSQAATTWTITYGYMVGGISIETFANVSGELVKVVPKTVAFSNGVATVTFSTAYSGEAYII